jgi:V8-like Glu-specific endopeptidase
MFEKRNSLPFPPQGESPELEPSVETRDNLVQQREALMAQVEELDISITRVSSHETPCGHTDDSQDVEKYDGTLGVTKDFVNQFSPPVGQLQWQENLADLFSKEGESPGNVEGKRWCTGCLIEGDKFLTAGHCFDQTGGGWQRPSRGNKVISPEEIATLMHVNFNFQIDPTTDKPRPDDRFPIINLLEYREDQVDYAIIQLGRNEAGESPSGKYGTLNLSPQDLTHIGSMLCVIQHPNGNPKKIEAGPLIDHKKGQLFYDDIDTQGGSSGSPILAEKNGNVVGVHTNGGCSEFSGANVGVSIGAIRGASKLLDSAESPVIIFPNPADVETVDNETPIKLEDTPCFSPLGEESLEDLILEAVPFPAVDTQLPIEGTGYYSYSQFREKQFGLTETIEAIKKIGELWFASHRTGPVIGIGNISKKGGGPVPPHSSHQTGLDVDFRLLRTDGARIGITFHHPNYSRTRTQALVNTIKSNPILKVKLILCNDNKLGSSVCVMQWTGDIRDGTLM